MQNKKAIIIIAVLSMISLGLGYWYGMPKEGSGGGGGKKEPAFLKQGLVAYYPFNGNAKDESGNGHDGTVNGATLNSDRFGIDSKAYNFDGSNDYISVPDHNDLDLGAGAGEEMTVSLWFKNNGNKGTAIGKFSTLGSGGVDYTVYLSAPVGKGITWGTGPSSATGGDDVNA